MGTIFVAFGHRKRVGKDTAARLLCSHLRIKRKNSNIQFHGFADKGKQQCYELYSWAGLQPGPFYEDPANEHLKDEILPKLGMSPRRIWINFMSRVAREVYPDTWVDYLIYNTHCDICIIKDLRFPNEADKIHKAGGYVFKIERPDIIHVPDEADDPLEEYPEWDRILLNDTCLGAFNAKIVDLAEDLLLQIPTVAN